MSKEFVGYGIPANMSPRKASMFVQGQPLCKTSVLEEDERRIWVHYDTDPENTMEKTLADHGFLITTERITFADMMKKIMDKVKTGLN